MEDDALLKPIAVVEHERAWQRIAEVKSRVRDLKPISGQTDAEAEEEMAEAVREFRHTEKKCV